MRSKSLHGPGNLFAVAAFPFSLQADTSDSASQTNRKEARPIADLSATLQAMPMGREDFIAEPYRGDADNGALANQGIEFHEGLSGSGSGLVDWAERRAIYNKQLDPDRDARP
ncbi:hypothetical protein [Paraburkholderia caballeronis]|uniref:hypothetical protein n=1 Tax=Paraburkholderia caballeronis TaxID=416943 RepID=UPI001065D90F|nr:hypothetical protein [Paraburkholderia caballeronis]